MEDKWEFSDSISLPLCDLFCSIFLIELTLYRRETKAGELMSRKAMSNFSSAVHLLIAQAL
jgi:hypothetical protein